MTDFGTWLDTYIASQHPPIGRPELARLSRIDVRTIGRWINGDTRPKPDNLRALAPVLGVSYGELLTLAGYGAPTTPAPEVTAQKAIDPLAYELGDMLDPDLGLPDERRQRLRLIVDQVMEVEREFMKKRRRRRSA